MWTVSDCGAQPLSVVAWVSGGRPDRLLAAGLTECRLDLGFRMLRTRHVDNVQHPFALLNSYLATPCCRSVAVEGRPPELPSARPWRSWASGSGRRGNPYRAGLASAVSGRSEGSPRPFGPWTLATSPTITAAALSAVWVIPGLSLREQVVGRGRAPGPPCVRVQGGDVPQDRVHHPPGGLDRVLPGEQPLLAVERRADEPVVGPHVRAGLLREDQLVDLRPQPGPRLLARDREPHLRLRPDAEPEGVHALERVEAEDVLGWPACTCQRG